MDWKPVTSGRSMPRFSASATTARARGCSLRASTAAASRSRSPADNRPDSTVTSSLPIAHWRPSSITSSLVTRHSSFVTSTVVTSGLPTVSVPVLSKATTLTVAAFSTWTPPLNSTPRRAPLPMADRTVAGVLMTMAQGEAATMTVMAV